MQRSLEVLFRLLGVTNQALPRLVQRKRIDPGRRAPLGAGDGHAHANHPGRNCAHHGADRPQPGENTDRRADTARHDAGRAGHRPSHLGRVEAVTETHGVVSVAFSQAGWDDRGQKLDTTAVNTRSIASGSLESYAAASDASAIAES